MLLPPVQTGDAASAWWLLGEGDLAVIGSYNGSAFESFPNTAFMRTARARSVYRVRPCDQSDHFDLALVVVGHAPGVFLSLQTFSLKLVFLALPTVARLFVRGLRYKTL